MFYLVNSLFLKKKSSQIVFFSFNVSYFWLQSSINGSASNIPDSTGRTFTSSFSGQSAAGSPVFHHAGTYSNILSHSFFELVKFLKVKAVVQEVFSRFTTCTGASTSQTCRARLHRGTRRWAMCHPEVFNSRPGGSLADGSDRITFLWLSLRYIPIFSSEVVDTAVLSFFCVFSVFLSAIAWKLSRPFGDLKQRRYKCRRKPWV